jgi:hypothetical protein
VPVVVFKPAPPARPQSSITSSPARPVPNITPPSAKEQPMNKMQEAAARARAFAASTGGARTPPTVEARPPLIFKQNPSVLPPKANVAMQINKAYGNAQALLARAKNNIAIAKNAVPRGQKEIAGQAAIAAYTDLRNAAVLKQKADKTMKVMSLEAQALVKEQKAAAITYRTDAKTQPFGGQGEDAARATAQMLKDEAASLRTSAAVIARAPDVPEDFPSPARAAQVVSKFNARVHLQRRGDLPMEVVSTLKGLGQIDTPESVIESMDPEVMLNYYGADALGMMMTRLDLGDVGGLAYLSGMANGLSGLGKSLMPGGAKVQAKVKGSAAFKAEEAKQMAAQAAFDTGTQEAMVMEEGEGFFSRYMFPIGGGLVALAAIGGGIYWWKFRK